MPRRSEWLDPVEHEELALVLRWCASTLTATERFSLGAYASGMTQEEAGRIIGITRGGVFMAQQSALRKMRLRLARLGITSSEDICAPR